jgi:hypothetical protein
VDNSAPEALFPPGIVGPAADGGPMTHLIPLSPWNSYRALGPIRDVYAHLLTEAVRWQDGRDRRTDPDHFALICVATDAGFGDRVSPTRWTRTAFEPSLAVYHVLRCDIPNWCSLHRCLWPLEVVEAQGNPVGWEWFDFLAGTGRLDPASDPPAELRKPLLCYGGLDERGRLRTDDGPAPVECECHLPYRETVQLLNRLGRQCEYSGRSPLDVLRSLVGEGSRHPGREEWEAMRDDLRDDLRDIEQAGLSGLPYEAPDDDPPWG